MNRKYVFYTSCTGCYEEQRRAKLNAMIEVGRDVSRATFMKHCGDSARQVFRQLGYASHPSQGLTAAQDFHIAYYRSTWGSEPCYYFVWSAIEHIFLPDLEAA